MSEKCPKCSFVSVSVNMAPFKGSQLFFRQCEKCSHRWDFGDLQLSSSGDPVKSWCPELDAEGLKIFSDASKVHVFNTTRTDTGSYPPEFFTGRNIAVAHRLIRHAYENTNAQVWIFTDSTRCAKEGILHEIITLAMPQWRDNLGVYYSQLKSEPLDKSLWFYMCNESGGTSYIVARNSNGSTPMIIHAPPRLNLFVYIEK